MNELDATEVLYALQVRLNLVGQSLPVAGTYLINVELHHDTLTGIEAFGIIIATVEVNNLILGEFNVVITVTLIG